MSVLFLCQSDALDLHCINCYFHLYQNYLNFTIRQFVWASHVWIRRKIQYKLCTSSALYRSFVLFSFSISLKLPQQYIVLLQYCYARKLSYKHVLKLEFSRTKNKFFWKENTSTMDQCCTFATYYFILKKMMVEIKIGQKSMVFALIYTSLFV